MGNGGGASQGQTGDHSHDGGEGHGGQEAQQQAATHGVRQVHGSHVGATDQVGQHVEAAIRTDVEELRIAHQQGDGAEADDEGQDVEVADEAARPDHRLTRFLGTGDGEEAHQDVRQTGSTKGQRQAQRQRVQRVAGHGFARGHQLLGVRVYGDGFGQQGIRAEVEGGQHQHGQQRAAGQHQHGLDDLHPGGRGHAAEEHIDHHQRADDHHGDLVLDAEQQNDQLAGTDHLGDQVQGNDGQRGTGGQDAHLRLAETEGRHVGEVEATQVTQALGDQEHHHGPAEQEADGVDHTVVAGDIHQTGDAQEGRGGDVVTGDGQTILEAGDTATGGVEVGGGLGLARRPPGDYERARDEQQEHHDGFGVGTVPVGGKGRLRGQRQQRRTEQILLHFTSLRTASSSGSKTLLENHTYSAIMMTALQTTSRPTSRPTLMVQVSPSGSANTSGKYAMVRMKPA